VKKRNTSHRQRAEQARAKHEAFLINGIDQRSKKAAGKTTPPTAESKPESNQPDAPAKADPYQKMLRLLDVDIAARGPQKPA